jgi:hypothetical protein
MDYSAITGERYAFVPVPEDTPTITVTSNAEYRDAVENLTYTGGTILVDTSGGAFRLDLDRAFPQERIVVTSADPDAPSDILGMNLIRSQNLTFTGLSFDGGESGGSAAYTVSLRKCSGIEFAGNTITGSADGKLGIDTTIAAASGIQMDGCTDTVVADNMLSGLSHGIGAVRSEGTLIQGNVITRMQQDVMRVVSSRDTTIDRNVVDDLYGSTAMANHADIVQYWDASRGGPVRDLTITNNYFNSGDAAYQGIYGGGTLRGPEMYTGLLVDNNLIVTGGAVHGITVNSFVGATVTNNTLLYNANALHHRSSDSTETTNGQPYINLGLSENVTVTGNIGALRGNGHLGGGNVTGKIVVGNNLSVNYDDPSDPNHVDALFVNAGAGDLKDVRDFQAIAGSAVDGIGSSLTHMDGLDLLSMSVKASSILPQVYDFSVFAPQDGVSYVWITADGRSFAGAEVSILLDRTGPTDVTLEATHLDGTVETITRNVTSESAILFDFDPETGFPKTGAQHATKGDPVLAMAQDGSRMVLSVDPDDQFGVGRLQEEFNALEAFSIQFEFRQDTPDVGGDLLHNRGTLRVNAKPDGSIYVGMQGENFTTEPGLLSDGGWHTLTLSYDGRAGGSGLSVRLDDAVIGALDVEGVVGMARYPIMAGAWNRGQPGIDGEIGGLRILDVPTASDAEVADPFIRVPQEMMIGIEIPAGDVPVRAAPLLLVESGLAVALVSHVDIDTLAEDATGDVDTMESPNGEALVFDGTARTSIVLDGMEGLSGSDAFTVAMTLGIEDLDQSGKLMDLWGLLKMWVDTSGTLNWRTTLLDADGAGDPQRGTIGTEASARLGDGDMHRLVLSYAEDDGGLSIWLDGALVAEHAMSGTIGQLSRLMLGNTRGDTFHGHVTDVAVFRAAADAASVADDAAAFRGPASPAGDTVAPSEFEFVFDDNLSNMMRGDHSMTANDDAVEDLLQTFAWTNAGTAPGWASDDDYAAAVATAANVIDKVSIYEDGGFFI